MYLHLGQDTVITTETVIGILIWTSVQCQKRQGIILLPPKKEAEL